MGKNIFDQVANFYEKIFPEHIFNYYLKKRVNFIKKIYSNRDCKILDVGCGTGALISLLNKEGYNVWGIDNSENMVKIANKRIPGKIIKGDMLNLPFPSESFDLVISVVSLHHLGNLNKVKTAIKEMARVTKKSGIILIWEHNPNNLYWYFLMKRVPQDTGDEKLIPARIILKEFRKNKISVIKTIKTGFVPDFAPKQILPLLDFLEKGIQKIFPLNLILAHNVIVGKKD
ncbi:MAG: class I SAM-dependent methyltransferase [Candidatus Omnitrophica bacterium]|nr:class I SAM-dependent methyltransferase [Candidatus Omnitrophota bacterium]MCM8802486.1 class I SAM-dependent methyltransferase [Candidatus Omnitrophota bacterium]